jgi:hypothetical protein
MKASLSLIIRLLFIAFVVALVLWRGVSEESLSVAANIILVVVLVTFMRSRYPERYQKDERTNRISAYSLSWSWSITYMLVSALILVDYFGLVELTASFVLSGIFFIMTATMLFLRWHFGNRGDVP